MVASRAPLRDEFLARVLVSVRERMEASGVSAEVTGRPKHLWSIYEKMVIRGKEFDELYDLVGIRVIVESEKDSGRSTPSGRRSRGGSRTTSTHRSSISTSRSTPR
jgi:(p)ppGpp synthase/HD superfamily hydrolase